MHQKCLRKLVHWLFLPIRIHLRRLLKAVQSDTLLPHMSHMAGTPEYHLWHMPNMEYLNIFIKTIIAIKKRGKSSMF